MSQLANTSVTTLSGVGPKLAEKLNHLHIHSVEDLLFHFPLRYQDRTRIYPINDLLPELHASVQGEIEKCDVIFAKRRMLSCRINDGTGSIDLKFFNFNAGQKNQMKVGRTLRAFGEIKRGPKGWQIIHPEYKFTDNNKGDLVDEHLTPVYPSTEGLKQNTWRSLTDQALDKLNRHNLNELIPANLLPHDLTLENAIRTLHRPTPEISLEALEQGKHPAQVRLALEELLAHNLSMLALRAKRQSHYSAPIKINTSLMQAFLEPLPFSPTAAQQRVVNEIQQDMRLDKPMMRLIQGDVGSGKTLVAALSALSALGENKQVALIAPTEILAEQHAVTFANWLTPLGIKVDWLAGKLTAKKKREAYQRIASGESKMIVGTHALFQEGVEYDNLSLVIVDEQHRFGVQQRLTLREKGEVNGQYPHQLIMTATPIPRTLAMTAYADLTTSVIDELPPGRTPVTTVALPNTRREEVIAKVRNACANDKRQVYWVCTLIEESEVLQCQAAEETAMQLQSMLPELSIGLVHGRMKAGEKQQVMAEFKQANMDVLVATTVIEVGVDVPNASLMIIENPERLGLSQLHQLRGRVGRGATASHCVLMYNNPLSKVAQQRLSVMRESNDGFYIAEKDLEIRGPGDLLGTKQTGEMSFRVADLLRDAALIPEARNLSQHILSQHKALAPQLVKRWIGDREVFTNA